MAQWEFPHLPFSDIEECASAAFLEIFQARRLDHWEAGAIGLWARHTRLRLLDEIRRHRSRRTTDQRAAGSDSEWESIASSGPTVCELVERTMSGRRVEAVLSQLSGRAATYARLRILEGGRRRELMQSEGWTPKQYQLAQAAAKRELRALLGQPESQPTTAG